MTTNQRSEIPDGWRRLDDNEYIELGEDKFFCDGMWEWEVLFDERAKGKTPTQLRQLFFDSTNLILIRQIKYTKQIGEWIQIQHEDYV